MKWTMVEGKGKGRERIKESEAESSLRALHLKGRNVFLCLLIIFPLGLNSPLGQFPGFLADSKLIVLWLAS